MPTRTPIETLTASVMPIPTLMATFTPISGVTEILLASFENGALVLEPSCRLMDNNKLEFVDPTDWMDENEWLIYRLPEKWGILCGWPILTQMATATPTVTDTFWQVAGFHKGLVLDPTCRIIDIQIPTFVIPETWGAYSSNSPTGTHPRPCVQFWNISEFWG